MGKIALDSRYLQEVLNSLLGIPSPTGMTDEVVKRVCLELDRLGLSYELTRRGAIRATLEGVAHASRRAVVAHLDTLGAMVKSIRPNGRLGLVPIGFWSARFAEGTRVTIFSDADRTFRGTILPMKASGHVYNQEIDSQPSDWSNLEVRMDEPCHTFPCLWELGVRVGDYVAVDMA